MKIVESKITMRAFLLFLTMTIVLAFTPAIRGAQIPAVSLQVSYAGLSAIHMPLWVLKQEGLGKKYGLDLEIVRLRGGAQSMQALLAGSTQFAQMGGDAVVGAALKGADVVIVASSLSRHVFSLVANPEIKTAADLKGKKIGILRLGGQTEWVARLGVESLGLQPSDVVLFPLGASGARLVALEKNMVDAAVQTYPELFKLQQMGYQVLVDARKLNVDFPTSTITVMRDFLENKRELAKNFLRSYSDAIQVIRTNRQATTRAIAKYTRIEDQEALNETYDFFAPMMDVVPRLRLEAIDNVLTELREGEDQRRLQAKDLVDTSLLNELEKEGFFKR